MSIALLFLACFIFYGKSKYFPESLLPVGKVIKGQKKVASLVGYLLLFFSFFLFKTEFGLGTAIVLFTLGISFTYSFLLIVLTLNKNHLYFLVIISFLLIIIETLI